MTGWPGNKFVRNILSWNSTRPDSRVFLIPGPPNGPPCVWVPGRLAASDFNLLHNPALDMLGSAPLFPGDLTLAAWQRGNGSSPPPPLSPTGALVPPFQFPPRDVHSLVADPMFVGDPFDGKLSPDSPAIKQLKFVPLPDIESAPPRRRGMDASPIRT